MLEAGSADRADATVIVANDEDLYRPDIQDKRFDDSIHLYRMIGDKISIRALDLNCDFPAIAKQLNAIVQEHFSDIYVPA